MEQSLFDLAALLIKYEIVSLEDLWPHIESKMNPLPDGATPDEIDTLKDLQINNLDYLYKLHDKNITNPDSFKRDMDKQKIDEKHLEIERRRARMPCNFKIRLLQSCVRINDWETADDIVNGIYVGKFDFTWSRPLMQTIFKALDWCVTKLYR